jgi:hypothetical protein
MNLTSGEPEYHRHATAYAFTFVTERPAVSGPAEPVVAVKGAFREIWLHELGDAPHDEKSGEQANPPELIIDLDDQFAGPGYSKEEVERLVSESLRLAPPQQTFLLDAPFAVAHRGEENWAAAWVAPNGLWFVQGNRASAGQTTLKTPLNGTLLSGELAGTSLQFSKDGTKLVWIQQTRSRSEAVFRVFDVQPDWLNRIQDGKDRFSDEEVIAFACDVVRNEWVVRNRSGSRSSSTEPELQQYQLRSLSIEDEYRKPCAHQSTLPD